MDTQSSSLPPLTRRQRDILTFIQAYVAEHDLSPTLEEIAQNFGVNKVTIFGHVSEMERKGVLQRRGAKGASRSIQLVDHTASTADTEPTVPILGSIAAGAPIDALENPEPFELASLVPSAKDVYALRVQGQSMIEDGIHDGDLVLVERRHEARDGEIVVGVLPDEEATLKRLYREPDGYRLEPANATMQPIHTRELEVRGVVIGVIRQF